jgi:4-hydroxybenzoate polyprenyltransferase/phosphoserine phosphatase
MPSDVTRPDVLAPASEPQSSNIASAPASAKRGELPPLVVDLDGTLLKTDLLLESFFGMLRQAPLAALALPFWLLKGRARLKREIASRVGLNVALLPYRTELVEQLRVERAKGRSIVLATASDDILARQVADYLQLFDSVLASDGKTNLSGERKRKRLVSEFGEKGFDYAGDGSIDLAVWPSARKAIVVDPNQHLLRAVGKVAAVESVVDESRPSLVEYLKALRPQQWLKNVLVFVPLFAAHRFHEPELMLKSLLAFAAFCCCASSGYVFNDLLDLSADRHHPRKRLRPFASGRLPLAYGLVMVPTMLILGCVLAAFGSRSLVGVVLLYLALTLAYSFYIKTVALLDCLVLAGLYTLRIMGGSVAVGIWLSPWLLAFSMFLFISLALVKRYDELVVMRSVDGDHAKARAYEIGDAELLASKGTASGYAAALVLALYVSSTAAKALYRRPEFMWFLVPLLLYWIGQMWLVAHRGKMIDDPLVFALRDRTSQILIVLMLGMAVLAA